MGYPSRDSEGADQGVATCREEVERQINSVQGGTILRNHPGDAVEMDVEIAAGVAPVLIRPAQLSDVGAMLRLINDYAASAVMLPRTELEICESLRDFLVAIEGEELVGCGALHFYTQHMSELRSLAVAPHRTGTGLGQHIARALLEQAHQLGVD